MAKWALSAIVGTLILLTIGGATLYNSDIKLLFEEHPDTPVFIFKYDSGNKIEIVTHSDFCDYALFRVTKDEISAKCGWWKVLDAKWYLEYYKTYGDDEWVRLERKASQITLDVESTADGFRIIRKTPYYAVASRSGTGGVLTETIDVSKDRLKSSLKFDTDMDNRLWRAIWQVDPNTEVVKDDTDHMLLNKQMNIFFDDAIFDHREDNAAYYGPEKGSFEIDPLIVFGNSSSSSDTETFRSGYCDECVNTGNVSFDENSSAFSAVYMSGWIEANGVLRIPDNVTSLCSDVSGGAGKCSISVRNGSQIIGDNDSDTIVRCLLNESLSCYGGGGYGGRSMISSGHDFIPGGIMDFSGIEVNGSTTPYLSINNTDDVSTNWTGTNYTLNLSQGSLEMMVNFR